MSKDKTATRWAIVTFLISSIILTIIPILFPQLALYPTTLNDSIPLYIFLPVAAIFVPLFVLGAFFLAVGIIHGLARLLGGKGMYMELIRPLGLASIFNIIGIIPFLNLIATGWSLVISVIVLKEVEKISTLKATIVVLIPFLLWIVVGFLTEGMAFFTALLPR